jgi:hypothetical protein
MNAFHIRVEDKALAIKLRRQGYSYNEIRSVIPNLSKSTLSGWLKYIELSEEHKNRIIQKIKNSAQKASQKGSWTNKQKAFDRINNIQIQAESEFELLSTNQLFVIGLCLYWAEGAKRSRSFQFMNSDPKMIKVIIKWLTEILNVNSEDIKIRLFIHEVYRDEKCEEFWSNITGVSVARLMKTVIKPSPHRIKKNPNYKGCCRIEITKSEIFWKIIKWQEMLASKIV